MGVFALVGSMLEFCWGSVGALLGSCWCYVGYCWGSAGDIPGRPGGCQDTFHLKIITNVHKGWFFVLSVHLKLVKHMYKCRFSL